VCALRGLDRTKPSDQQDYTPPERPSRLRAAFSVLRGERLVQAQIQAEWAEYQLLFNDLLLRFSALLARSAKAEKQRVRKQVEPEAPSQRQLPLSYGKQPKSQLRSMAAARLGLSRFQERFQQSPPPPEEEPQA